VAKDLNVKFDATFRSLATASILPFVASILASILLAMASILPFGPCCDCLP
jgi:hypothetical protein